jgi:hypothetical protein
VSTDEKRCTNPSCSMRNIDVKVDAEKCLGCGRELALSGLAALRNLFGDAYDGLFGGKS